MHQAWKQQFFKLFSSFSSLLLQVFYFMQTVAYFTVKKLLFVLSFRRCRIFTWLLRRIEATVTSCSYKCKSSNKSVSKCEYLVLNDEAILAY